MIVLQNVFKSTVSIVVLLTESGQLLGNQLQITWLDEQHWHLEGTVAILDIVWWLEVKGTFLGVLKGTYVPVLHLEFHTAMELENVICTVSVDSTLGQVLPNSPKGDTLDDDSLSHRAPNPPYSNSLLWMGWKWMMVLWSWKCLSWISKDRKSTIMWI